MNVYTIMYQYIFIYVYVYIYIRMYQSLLLFMAELNSIPLWVLSHLFLLTCQWTFGYFHFKPTVNSAALNINVQIFVWTSLWST